MANFLQGVNLLDEHNQYCGEESLDPATKQTLQRNSSAATARARAQQGVKAQPVWYSCIADMPVSVLRRILNACEPVAFSEANLKTVCVRGDKKTSSEELARPMMCVVM